MKRSKKILAAAAVLALTSCTKYDPSESIAEALYGPPPDEEQDETIPDEEEHGEENSQEDTQEIQEEEETK